MKLKNISLENFRNYSKYSLVFPEDKNLTILVGDNGLGKTNLLESIYLLSLGKSFRSHHNDDIIEWKKDYLRCTAELEAEDDIKLEVFYSRKPIRQKSFKRNDIKLTNGEFLGSLITVLFHPEDLNMLYLSPSLRRKYLNIVLCQTDKKYLNALSQYKKVLKQRSALLHTIRKTQFDGGDTSRLLKDLDAWDKELAQFGTKVMEKRLHFVAFISECMEDCYQKISGDKAHIEIKYQSKIFDKVSEQSIHSLFQQALIDRRTRDIIKAETSAGPHRDDLCFFIDGKEISQSASRGEFRTILLAIKLAEIKFIEKITGKKPILLLDDVFSELDPDRQKRLLEAIEGCQAVITATDIYGLGELGESKNSLIVKID
jgi:DNA replication and repair protein RecF